MSALITSVRSNILAAPMRTVLHLTGMIATKYGSMERYLVETVRQCSLEGYESVLQYEALPTSEEHVAALKSSGAEVIALPTTARGANHAVRLARLVGRVRPAGHSLSFSG